MVAISAKALVYETDKNHMIMSELQRGQVAVRKKDLLDLISIIQLVENNIDVLMKEKESFERGKKIAKELNRLTFQRHAFEHFQLNIPLKQLK